MPFSACPQHATCPSLLAALMPGFVLDLLLYVPPDDTAGADPHIAVLQVRVEPRSNALANGATVAELTTRDNGDGTYTASYAVTARGDYEVPANLSNHDVCWMCS